MAAGSNGQRRYLVISADGHDMPAVVDGKIRPYLPAKHHEAFDVWLTQHPALGLAGPDGENPFKAIFRMSLDEEWADEAAERYWTGEPVHLDPKKRVEILEASGVAGELLMSMPPVMPEDEELNNAAMEAHTQWLIDYCGAVPGRLAAYIDPDYTDLDGALSYIRRCRDAGLFGGVVAPTHMHSRTERCRAGGGFGGAMPPRANAESLDARWSVPTIADPHWEPLWALCEELQLPIVTHGEAAPDGATVYPKTPGGQGVFSFEAVFFAVRKVWLLMAAGVFDRYPGLKLAFVESPFAAIAGLLQDADLLMNHTGSQPLRQHLTMLPSEYWRRHCVVGASFIDPAAAALRHEIGVETLCWGADYPHPEGSWPTVLPAMQYGLGGLPDAELRAILGENAAKVWDFDLTQLQAIADRVGPTAEDLATPLGEDDKPPYTTAIAMGQVRRPAHSGA